MKPDATPPAGWTQKNGEPVPSGWIATRSRRARVPRLPLPASVATPDRDGQLLDGRPAQEIGERDLDGRTRGSIRAYDEPHGDEGVAAEVEEVVVDAATDGTDRTSAKIAEIRRSTSSPGSAGLATSAASSEPDAAFRALRSSLPVTVSRQRAAAATMMLDGDHVAPAGGAFRGLADGDAARSKGSPRRPTRDVGGERRLAPAVRPDHDRRVLHPRASEEGRFDLAELDAEAPHLDLVVDPAEEFELPVGPPPRQVARAVEPAAGPGPERVGQEPLGRQRGAVEVAPGEPPSPPM